MRHRARLWTLAGLAAVGVLIACVYHPALGFGFLHWDDGTYVARNPYINHFDWEFVRWALTTTYFSYWHPLTWLSHGLDYALWGGDAGGHHLTNLVLFGIEALGVFALTLSLLRASDVEARGAGHVLQAPRLAAGVVAAVAFVVHPQHVEVVAWVSERKELLATMFIIGAVLAWIEYGSRGARGWLFVTFLLYLLALMAKPIAVTLPAVLLVLDHYPLNRLTRANWLRLVVIEKLPFFLASAVVAVMTILAQAEAGAIQVLPWTVRVLNACNSSLLYLWHWIWPFGLSAFYPFPAHVTEFSYRSLLPPAALLAITAFAISRYRAGRKAWLSVWLVYLLTLLPVAGILHSGPQAAAERYAHLPTLGFYVLFAAGVVHAWRRTRARARVLLAAVLAALALAFGITAHRQTFDWRDDQSLWQSVAARYPGQSALVHVNLGNALFAAGRPDAAEAQYLAALAAPGGRAHAYANLASALRAQGDRARAIALFTELAERNPADGLPLEILGEIYERQGEREAARTYYEKALQRDPSLAGSHFRLANLHLLNGDVQAAATALSAAIEAAPDYVDALLLLARIYGAGGYPDRALLLNRKAYAISPSYAPAYHGLIASLRRSGLGAEADAVFEKASRLRGFEALPAGR